MPFMTGTLREVIKGLPDICNPQNKLETQDGQETNGNPERCCVLNQENQSGR